MSLFPFHRSLLLENALAFAHSRKSKDIHPLLAEASPAGSQADLEVDKLTEVLGTLAVGEAGEVRYFGPFAVIEVPFGRSCRGSIQTNALQTLYQVNCRAIMYLCLTHRLCLGGRCQR